MLDKKKLRVFYEEKAMEERERERRERKKNVLAHNSRNKRYAVIIPVSHQPLQ